MRLIKFTSLCFSVILFLNLSFFHLFNQVFAFSLENFIYRESGSEIEIFAKISSKDMPTSCTFESIRPSINQSLSIVQPSSSSPEIAYCAGKVSIRSGTAIYWPSTKIIASKNRSLPSEITNPKKYQGQPSINSIKINNVVTRTAEVSKNGSLNVEALITDEIGNIMCEVSIISGSATVGQIVNYFNKCIFSINSINSNTTLKIISKNPFNVNSSPSIINLSVKPESPTQTPPTQTPPTQTPPAQTPPAQTQPTQTPPPQTQQTNINLNQSPDNNTNQVDLENQDTSNQTELSGKDSTNISLSSLELFTSTGDSIVADITDLSNLVNDTNRYTLVFIVGIILLILSPTFYLTKFNIIKKIKGRQIFQLMTFVIGALLTFGSLALTARIAYSPEILSIGLSLSDKNTKKAEDIVASHENFSYGPIIQSLKESSSYENYDLSVQIAETNQGKVWGKEFNLDPNKNFVSLLKIDKFDKNKLMLQVDSHPLSSLHCKINYTEIIEPVKVSGDYSIFTVDFSKIIPKQYLNGNYNGKLTYYLRVTDIADSCEKSFYSNNVKISLLSEKAIEKFLPDATKLILKTSGLTLKSNEEIDNLNSEIFIEKTPESKDLYFYITDLTENKFPVYGRWEMSLSPFNNNSCTSSENLVSFQYVDASKSKSPIFKINTAIFDQNEKKFSDFQAISSSLPVSILKAFNVDFKQSIEKKTRFLTDENIGNKNLSYYVRFIALNPDDGSCNAMYLPSSQVKIQYGELSNTALKVFKHEYHEVEVNTDLELISVEYQPVKFQSEWFNPVGHYIYTKDVTYLDNQSNTQYLAKKGDKFYISSEYTKSNETFLDKINKAVNSIPEFVKAVAKIMNYVAEQYNSIKTLAINGLAGGLSSLGVPCNSECKAMLNAGLSIAQSAIGLPPSLPNFDQLVNQGIDYMAAELAEQVGENLGVPLADVVVEELAKETLNRLKDEISKANDDAVKSSPLSFKPDPDYLYNPAILKVKVKNNGSKPSGGYLNFKFIDTNDLAEVDLKVRNLYEAVGLDIPIIKPNQILEIPIILKENYFDYRSFKLDSHSEYVCSTSDGKCNQVVQNDNYVLNLRKSRWLKIYEGDKNVKFELSISGKNYIPNFDPALNGFDVTKWVKIGNNFGSQVWFDSSSGTYHHFTPKPLEKLSIQDNIQAKKAFKK